LQTEGVTLTFRADAIEALARIAVEVNMTIENIGARRLQTIMEKLLEDVSFTAPDRSGQEIVIDRPFVESQIADLARNADLSRFVL
jgi:ATP-dependent HslUV protease ATP-binding subunit HslU